MVKSFEELSSERKILQERGLLPDWYTTQAYQMFIAKYQVPGEEYVLGRFKTIAKTLAAYMGDKAPFWEETFFKLLWKGWLSPASPVLANTGTDRGLNVSCSGGVVPDSVDGFYSALHEQAMLSKNGFGCSGYFGGIRPRGAAISGGGKASGVAPVIDDFAIMASKISQGSSRRGATASYLPISHGDFYEVSDVLEATPDGLNIGWIVDDAFIAKLVGGDEDANQRFSRALYVKLVTGKGYFFFVDKANRHRPQMYKDLGLDIKATNLCTEIMLHSSDKLSFSCILSSMNLYKYDEWKDTSAIFDATVFLDCLVSDFLAKSEGIPGLEKVREFTKRGRAIGLGVLGFSSYLQKNKIPFESLQAMFLNREIFRNLQDQTEKASEWLAEELGEPEWCKGYGKRFTHTTALAPTKSTSILMGGVSESVFPDPGFAFEQPSAAGGMFRIPPEFYYLMKAKGKYNEATINSIIENVGSVQHFDWLTDHEKLVFRTAFEVDQNVILRLASQRQKYLTQGQSLNFFVSEDGDEDRIAELITSAFLDENILSLYYIYSRSGVIVNSDCVACEA